MVDKLDRAVSDSRRINNVDTRIGYTGDGTGSGDPRTRDNTGRMWVRFQSATGYTRAVPYPVASNANVPIQDNIAIVMGYEDGEECILRVSRDGFRQSGSNPGLLNPLDRQAVQNNTPAEIPEFMCRRSANSAKPWAVVVSSGYIEIGGVSRLFDEKEIDFNTEGLVPTAGTKCMGAVYLKSDLTLQTFASTPILMTDPMLPAYIDECRQKAALGSMSIWGWVLEGGASGLSEDVTKNIDLRPKFQMPATRSATVATTDATVTTLASIAVAELQMITITATINGLKSDYSAVIGGTLTAVVRRASGGNVTLVGSVTVDIHEDSAGSPVFSLDVDTGSQTARIRVTAIVAENWQWTAKYATLAS